jgi:hypothetical protein
MAKLRRHGRKRCLFLPGAAGTRLQTVNRRARALRARAMLSRQLNCSQPRGHLGCSHLLPSSVSCCFASCSQPHSLFGCFHLLRLRQFPVFQFGQFLPCSRPACSWPAICSCPAMASLPSLPSSSLGRMSTRMSLLTRLLTRLSGSGRSSVPNARRVQRNYAPGPPGLAGLYCQTLRPKSGQSPKVPASRTAGRTLVHINSSRLQPDAHLVNPQGCHRLDGLVDGG